MRTFNTYTEILEATKGHQVTAQELINKRTYINGEGWQDIELTPELKAKLCRDIADKLGGRNKTKTEVEKTLLFGTPQHWGLRRVFIEQYNGGEPFVSYCAGQDYQWETNAIRTALK